MLKIQTVVVNGQSPSAVRVMPRRRLIGKLNTDRAYAWPMHIWMARAAGGTSQRLYPGGATVCARSRNENNVIGGSWFPRRRALHRDPVANTDRHEIFAHLE